jgi:hypothetical protein
MSCHPIPPPNWNTTSFRLSPATYLLHIYSYPPRMKLSARSTSRGCFTLRRQGIHLTWRMLDRVRVCSVVGLFHCAFFSQCYTGWSKNHEVNINIFTDGCNSTYFNWINEHTIPLWLHNSPRRSCYFVTCWRQSVGWLSTVEVQEYPFHKRFSVHCRTLTGMSFLLNLPELVYGYIYRVSLPNESTVSRLLNPSRDTGTHHRVTKNVRKDWTRASLKAVDFYNT